MRIAFEDVSYSYANPARQEKRRRRARKRREAGVVEAPASVTAHGRADWGSDPEGTWALCDLTFTLEPGEFLGLAGHTGSGKSTLTQLMNGLLRPTFGTVTLDGRDLADHAVAQTMRGKVGLVFQYPENQLFAPTVAEDVAFGPRNLGLSEEEIRERVAEALAAVHLNAEEVGPRSPFELSGGQQRRVAFAGVLAMRPSVLILDEPIAGLDPLAKEEFLCLITELHASGIGVVMVSHNMDDLARLADRILVLNNGRLFALDTPEAVFSERAALQAIGLDVPQAQQMASELRACGFELPRPLYADARTLAEDLAPQLARRTPRTEVSHARP